MKSGEFTHHHIVLPCTIIIIIVSTFCRDRLCSHYHFFASLFPHIYFYRVSIEIDEKSPLLGDACRHALRCYGGASSGFFTAPVGHVNIRISIPSTVSSGQSTVIERCIPVTMTKSACFMLDKYQDQGLPTPVTQSKLQPFSHAPHTQAMPQQQLNESTVQSVVTMATGTSSGVNAVPAAHVLSVPANAKPQAVVQQQGATRLHAHENSYISQHTMQSQDMSNVESQLQYQYHYKHASVTATHSTGIGMQGDMSTTDTANADYDKGASSAITGNLTANSVAATVAATSVPATPSPQHQLIKRKTGVFFRRSSISFGAVPIGSLTRTKIELCNSTDNEVRPNTS